MPPAGTDSLTAIALLLARGFVQRFHRETCCITDLYSGVLQQTRFDGHAVVKVSLTLHDGSLSPSLPHDRLLLNVLVGHSAFDFDRYQQSANLGKKAALASCVASKLYSLAPNYGWDFAVLQNVASQVGHRLPDIRGEWRRRFANPNGQYSVSVEWNYDIDGLELTAVLWKQGGRHPLGRKFMGRVTPSMGCLTSVLKAAKWIDANTFGVRTPGTGRKQLTVDFDEQMIAK